MGGIDSAFSGSRQVSFRRRIRHQAARTVQERGDGLVDEATLSLFLFVSLAKSGPGRMVLFYFILALCSPNRSGVPQIGVRSAGTLPKYLILMHVGVPLLSGEVKEECSVFLEEKGGKGEWRGLVM